jgi:hypothetical protein
VAVGLTDCTTGWIGRLLCQAWQHAVTVALPCTPSTLRQYVSTQALCHALQAHQTASPAASPPTTAPPAPVVARLSCTTPLPPAHRYVEQQDGQFPPAPLERDIPLPVYGAIHRDLEWWKQRRFNVVTWSALDMLFDERQLKYYRWVWGLGAGGLLPWGWGRLA